MGGSPPRCLFVETKFEMLNVKTRTFVLKLVHEVLLPGIQRAQRFLPMQGQPNPAPSCRYVWTGRRLIALLPNGWLPTGI